MPCVPPGPSSVEPLRREAGVYQQAASFVLGSHDRPTGSFRLIADSWEFRCAFERGVLQSDATCLIAPELRVRDGRGVSPLPATGRVAFVLSLVELLAHVTWTRLAKVTRRKT